MMSIPNRHDREPLRPIEASSSWGSRLSGSRLALPNRARYYGLMRQTAPLLLPLVAPRFVSLCRLVRVPAGAWPFQTLSLQVYWWMPGPPVGWVSPVHVSNSSQDNIALLPVRVASAFPQPSLQGTSRRTPMTGCSHSLMFRPATLLATQAAPTLRHSSVEQL